MGTMEKVSKIIEEPGGTEPPSRTPERTMRPGSLYVKHIYTNIALLWRGLPRDVFGHPKNLLDLKRQITRCGPLSIF